MNKLCCLIIFFLVCRIGNAQIPLPQLQAGVYVNDSISGGSYCFVGYCDTLGDVVMILDTNLILSVTGVQFKLIVTSLTTPPDSVYTLENGILHQGDTLTFTSTNNYFSFCSSAYGCATFKFIIMGTPLIPFENYPCAMEGWCTLSDCFNTCFNYGDTTNWCTVNDFSGISDPVESEYVKLSPNPITNEMTFKTGNNGLSEIILYDISSRKMFNQSFTNSTSINTSQLAKGIYLYEVRNKNGVIKKGKVVKE